jgi:hypothetical protein
MSRNSSSPLSNNGKDEHGMSNSAITPSKRFKFSDLEVIQKPSPRFFITEARGGIAVVSSEELVGCDAFIQPIIDDMTKPGHWLIRQEGFILATQRRVDQLNNFAQVNANSPFPRRVLVRVNPPEQAATTETRRAVLDRLVTVRKHCNDSCSVDYVLLSKQLRLVVTLHFCS